MNLTSCITLQFSTTLLLWLTSLSILRSTLSQPPGADDPPGLQLSLALLGSVWLLRKKDLSLGAFPVTKLTNYACVEFPAVYYDTYERVRDSIAFGNDLFVLLARS
jgi:hypothetical protein